MQYPVEDQAPKIDDTPVHNIGMEDWLQATRVKKPKLSEQVNHPAEKQGSTVMSGQTPSIKGVKDAALAKWELQLFCYDQMEKSGNKTAIIK